MTYEETLAGLALADERVVVMTAENRVALRSLPEKLGDRFIDTGITEQTMIGMAAGLALRGRIPVVRALAAFLTMRAFEFIRTDVGIAGLPVKLVGGVPGLLSEANGPTHQAVEDVALMRGIPGMGVFCPADMQEMALGLPAVLYSQRPFYIRYNPQPALYAHDANFEIGQAEQIGDGMDVAILTYGALVRQSYAACAILRTEAIDARLINLRTLAPLDEEAIVEAASECKLLVTVEDHFRTGGLYSAVCEVLTRRRLLADILPIDLEERWFRPGLLDEVLAFEGFRGPQIARRISERLG